MLTDGWRAVVNNLNLIKNTWLFFKSIGDKELEVYPFLNNVCGESYITMNNYANLGLTVIPTEFVSMFYKNHERKGIYQLYAAGKYWDVMAAKVHVTYAFTDGWPKLCDRLEIMDGDTMIFEKIDNAVFQLRVFRNGIEVVLGFHETSEDSDFCEIISKTTFQESVRFVSILFLHTQYQIIKIAYIFFF
ncbi:putative transcription factor B3-Domain family [Helianthus anomalus]